MTRILKKIKQGFTLIELLIVISIIGLLSAILIPNIAGAQTKAKEAAIKATIFNLQTELESYQIDNYTYPQGNNITLAELYETLELKNIPKNPFTGKKYNSSDQAGQIIYNYDEASGLYSLTGYKRDNSKKLFVLTNE